MTQQENRDESVNLADGSIHTSARAIINDKSKGYIIATLIALNLLGTVWMFVEWKMAERESRLLEYYLLELDAKVIAAGIKSPNDSIAGKLQHK